MAAGGTATTAEKRPSLVDDAYAAMKEAIRESTFPPGYQASAQEIALRLGMSRTPVHEASLKLQEEGLVRIVPKRGIVICALAPDDIREIYDVIIAIEGRAAELVAALPEAERRAIVADLVGNGTYGGTILGFARKGTVEILSLINISEPTRPY